MWVMRSSVLRTLDSTGSTTLSTLTPCPSQDEIEAIRFFSLVSLAALNAKNGQIPLRLIKVVETDPSAMIRSFAIDALCSNEFTPSLKSQDVDLKALMTKTLESDSSLDVQNSAIGGLLQIDSGSELAHRTLLNWAKSGDQLRVEYALSQILRKHDAGDRPQSIDELIELLSDPEWGTTVEVKQNNWGTYHRWARQYAIAILGKYAAHAYRALPTLEAELARNNKDTQSFATTALDSVRGYCPDRPIEQLQGQWKYVSLTKLDGSSPFLDLEAASDQQPACTITISGTQLKVGDRVAAEITHQRKLGGFVMLLDPDGRKLHCNGSFRLAGGPSPNIDAVASPVSVTLEICELRNDYDATQATKQIYELRR